MKRTCVLLASLLIASLTVPPVVARTRYCRGVTATIVGSGGRDRIRGTDRRDVIVGLSGNDTIHGRDGQDVICGGPGRDQLHGDVGNDLLDGDRGDDLLVGDRGRDSLVGDEDRDEVRGGAGDDRFSAGSDPDSDLLDGGPGVDLINMSVTEPKEGEPDDASGSAFVDLAAGVARGPDGGSDRIEEIENVYGTGLDDELFGDDGPNVLNAGYNGGGRLDGRGGDDILSTGQDGGTEMFGGPGDDLLNPVESNELDGGDGTDELSFCAPYAETYANIAVDLVEGRSEAQVRDEPPAVNTLASIENVTTCTGKDTVRGDSGDNVLDAGGNDDFIDGREGSDTCLGGEEIANCEA